MKRQTSVCLILLLLSLCGCAIPIGTEIYTTPATDPTPTERYSSNEVSGLEPGIYHYLMTETIEDLTTGVITRTEYIPGEEHPRIGLIRYENGEEVRREDWELDVQENITKCTVTEDHSVSEVFEYELTYNENHNLVTRVCSLNGEWRYTEELKYAPKYPDRLVIRYVSFPGEDNPPWYMYEYYDDGTLHQINRIQAREAKHYKIAGQVNHQQTMVYDEDGRLLEKEIWAPLETGGYLDQTEEYSYDEENLTVTIHTFDQDDHLLRITNREFIAVTIG